MADEGLFGFNLLTVDWSIDLDTTHTAIQNPQNVTRHCTLILAFNGQLLVL